MNVKVVGELGVGVTAKDLILGHHNLVSILVQDMLLNIQVSHS